MKMALWLLNCYPRRWRERYQEEMLALLEQHSITPKTVIDLFLGALDARLNSVYRSKDGFMLQHIRDNRSLSLIYLCALAVFLLSNNVWSYLIIMLSPGFIVAGASANNVGVLFIGLLVPVMSLISLLGVISITIGKAFKKGQWKTVIFALVCLGVTVWIVWLVPVFLHLDVSNLSDLFRIDNLIYLLDGVLPAFLFGGGLFLTGVEGLRLLRARRGRSLFFALLIGLLPPISLVIFIVLVFRTSIGSSLTEAILFVSWGFCSLSGLYLALSGLLLTLVTGTVTRRGWQTARIWGVLMTILLLARFISIVFWDVNRWIEGGGVWIFDPLLLINALLLAIALAFMVLALLRSFLIPAEERLPTPACA